MLPIKSFATAAALTFAAATANATVLDFTTTATFTGGISVAGAEGTFDGKVYGITTNPVGFLSFTQAQDGSSCAGNGLACVIDGLGVGDPKSKTPDDEISTSISLSESITVAFDGPVIVTGIYFLDLFLSEDGRSFEEAQVSIDGGPAHSGFKGLENAGSGLSGFAFYDDLRLIGSTFTFTALSTNDKLGVADYALAGLKVEPVPLPAGLLLLGGALGALGISRRRKAA